MENHKLSTLSTLGNKKREMAIDVNQRVLTDPPAVRVRRNFTLVQIFCFALSFMNSWEAMGTNITPALYNGGPRAMILGGFLIVFPGVLCQVAPLAEMSSYRPVAGAQYHWTDQFAPQKYRRPITWTQGWITWLAWVVLTAAMANVCASIIQTLVMVNYPDYEYKKGVYVGSMLALLLLGGLVNHFVFQSVRWIEMIAGILHICLFAVFVGVLWGLGGRHSSEFVFLTKANLSGWKNDFVPFNLGMNTVTWAFVGVDGAVHMSEDVRRARHAVPRAMFWSICLNGVLAFAFALILLFFMGPTEDVIGATYGLVPICINATKSVAGGSAMTGLFFITVISVSLGVVASVARLTQAWARDGGLPQCFAHIDPQHRVPVRSLWLSIGLAMLLCLLKFASDVALGVIISLSTFGLYQSYAIAIGCMICARKTGQLESHGWTLGRWGWPINIFALAFTVWSGCFLAVPSYFPIDAKNMNYALPISVVVWIWIITSWYVWAKKHWNGIDAEALKAVLADSDRDIKD